ncbi:Lsa25.6 family adhesin [Leptospira idonii]|uniref:Uncharacterized protein n=1 Tax=Leptospira idonii TaxID=1193500 RepID=A0A4R9M159_9LEPT|nr:hypothetical protein [Leptospira idonii]TGN18468.1 hypothetical protein EHS15_13825 [Leptospira idonii]
MIRFVLIVALSLFAFQCKDSSLPLPFGAEIRKMPVDSAENGTIDSVGYYIPEKDNYRLIYVELDKNGNGSSDEFIWQGHATTQDPVSPVKNMVKVHEEVDENHDGKIDLIRWLMPNEIIALAQKDSDGDGYFETTMYYNLKKRVVRREIDVKKEGRPTVFIFVDRAEIDSDGDSIPDLVVYGTSDLELEEKAINLRDTKPLSKGASYLFNLSLIPASDRAILGSGF